MAITNDTELEQAVAKMRLARTDLAEYELKTAKGGLPNSLAETISAFANTTGGTIILGITEKDFTSVPDLDIKALQDGVSQLARKAVQPAVATDVHVMSYGGNQILVANIPELPAREKPCYVRKYGRVNGSYIRTGDGNHQMTSYEIDRFLENQQPNVGFDMSVVAEATLDDLSAERVGQWLRQLRETSFSRLDGLDDNAILVNRRIIAKSVDGVLRPTVAGLMVFGVYPQKFFPRGNVVFSAYPDVSPSRGAMRFTDNVNVDGTIPQMIGDTLRVISRNIRHGAIVEGALRQDVPDYPLPALREALANALMHRDYSPEGLASPVQVNLYADRIEIANPGGLYGAIDVAALGKEPVTSSRNQFLSRLLEDITYTDFDGRVGHVVENRGSGIPTIFSELAVALMEPPEFESTLSRFKITFQHRRMTSQEGAEYSKGNVRQAILEFLGSHQSASSQEIAVASGLSQKTIRGYLNELQETGEIIGIGSKYSPKRRYRLKGSNAAPGNPAGAS